MKSVFLTISMLIYTNIFVKAQDVKVEQKIRELEEAEAVLKHDSTTLEKIWAEDFTVNTPANIIGTRKRGDRIRLYYSMLERNIEKLIVFDNNTVITMGNEVVKPTGEMPMAGQVLHRRYTNIWMKRNGEWQMAARHANIICTETKQ